LFGFQLKSFLVGNTSTYWLSYPKKPGNNLAEAQGNFVGNDFVVFGGFDGSWDKATNATNYYSTISNTWTAADSIPIPSGVTHMATIAVGNKIYGCGGYLGGTFFLCET
jgi:N-acetylneuraminic acid mutarotase